MSINVAIPSGHLNNAVLKVMALSGIELYFKEKYDQRPKSNMIGFNFFVVRPWNIPYLIAENCVDFGITGVEIAREKAKIVKIATILDFPPISLVIASNRPTVLLENKTLVIATDYPNICYDYFSRNNYSFRLLKTRGSCEGLVPEIADMVTAHIVTGTTLRVHNLSVIDILIRAVPCIVTSKNFNDHKEDIIRNFINRIQRGISLYQSEANGIITNAQVGGVNANSVD